MVERGPFRYSHTSAITGFKLALTLLLATAGGWPAKAIAIPAAPLLGAMAVTLVAALARAPLTFPRWLRRAVVVYIGLNVGAALKLQDLSGLAGWLPSVAVLLLSLPVSLALVAMLLRRFGNYTTGTAFFAAYPGHLVLVIQAATQTHSDVQRVTVTQSLRVLTLVGLLPWVVSALGATEVATASMPTHWLSVAVILVAGLVGVALAMRLGLPAPWMLGPMVGGAIASLAGARPGELPGGVTAGVMILTGAMIGTGLVGARLRTLLRVLPISVLAVALALIVAAAFAIPVNLLFGIPTTTLLLAYAPGGGDVMSILALATNQDPAFVGLHHLVRLLVMAAALPFLVRHFGES